MATTITNLTKMIKVAYSTNSETQYFTKGALNIWSVGDQVFITDSTKLHRDKPFTINWAEVSGETSSDSLVTTLLGYDDAYSESITLSGSNITTAAVITAITTESNWSTGSFVDPGGILSQITNGQVYIDTTNNIYYYYNGSVLVRWSVDNIG